MKDVCISIYICIQYIHTVVYSVQIYYLLIYCYMWKLLIGKCMTCPTTVAATTSKLQKNGTGTSLIFFNRLKCLYVVFDRFRFFPIVSDHYSSIQCPSFLQLKIDDKFQKKRLSQNSDQAINWRATNRISRQTQIKKCWSHIPCSKKYIHVMEYPMISSFEMGIFSI